MLQILQVDFLLKEAKESENRAKSPSMTAPSASQPQTQQTLPSSAAPMSTPPLSTGSTVTPVRPLSSASSTPQSQLAQTRSQLSFAALQAGGGAYSAAAASSSTPAAGLSSAAPRLGTTTLSTLPYTQRPLTSSTSAPGGLPALPSTAQYNFVWGQPAQPTTTFQPAQTAADVPGFASPPSTSRSALAPFSAATPPSFAAFSPATSLSSPPGGFVYGSASRTPAASPAGPTSTAWLPSPAFQTATPTAGTTGTPLTPLPTFNPSTLSFAGLSTPSSSGSASAS